MVPLIESRKIAATIYQRPREQGVLAFRSLYRFLADGLRPHARVYLDPVVVMRSNLQLVLRGQLDHSAKSAAG
jgi:LacI family transcriptional regulator